MKKLHIIFVLLALSGAAYANGVRVISLAEVPSSHRPWQIFLTADYAQQHLAEAKGSIFDVLGN